MEDKIRKSLDEVIDLKLKNLVTLKFDSEGKTDEVKELAELYKLRIEEEKIEADLINKTRQREFEKNTQMTETSLKYEQLRSQSWDRWINVGLQVGLTVMGLVAYNCWYNRGLKFEETGSITSPMTRNLLSRMLPKK
jgi:hypothetical protein